jgi:lipopolysaccharide export system protein LptA
MLCNRPISLATLLLLTLMCWSTAQSLPGDKDAPVEIEADSGELDQATNRTIYQGNVKITQGTLELRADKVVVRYRGNRPHEIIATGRPARFKQLPARDKEWIKGSGRRIVYRIHSDEMVLSGGAELLQNRDSFRSDRIVYDRQAGRLKAGAAAGGKSRVKVIVHPKGQP